MELRLTKVIRYNKNKSRSNKVIFNLYNPILPLLTREQIKNTGNLLYNGNIYYKKATESVRLYNSILR